MGKRISQCTHPSSWQYLYRQHFSSDEDLCIYHSNCPQNLQYTSQPSIYTSPSTLSVRNRDKCTIRRKLECWTVREAENSYSNSKSALELEYMQMYSSKRVKKSAVSTIYGAGPMSRREEWCTEGQHRSFSMMGCSSGAFVLFPMRPTSPRSQQGVHPWGQWQRRGTSENYCVTAEEQELFTCMPWQKYANLTRIRQQ